MNEQVMLRVSRDSVASWPPGVPPSLTYRDSAGRLFSTTPRRPEPVICLPDVHLDIINNILLISPFVLEILLNAARSFI